MHGEAGCQNEQHIFFYIFIDTQQTQGKSLLFTFSLNVKAGEISLGYIISDVPNCELFRMHHNIPLNKTSLPVTFKNYR